MTTQQIDLCHACGRIGWERALTPQLEQVDERLIELLADGLEGKQRRLMLDSASRSPIYTPARWLVPGEIGPGPAGLLGGAASWIECVHSNAWRLWRRVGIEARLECMAGATEVALAWVNAERAHHASMLREAASELTDVEASGFISALRIVEVLPAWAVLEGVMGGVMVRLRWCPDGWTWGVPVEVSYWEGHRRHGVSEGLAPNGRVGEAPLGRLGVTMAALDR